VTREIIAGDVGNTFGIDADNLPLRWSETRKMTVEIWIGSVRFGDLE
jgi:hypothetical protein